MSRRITISLDTVLEDALDEAPRRLGLERTAGERAFKRALG